MRFTITATLALVLLNACALAQPLASGQWSKFSVTGDGVHRIDYALLKKSGIDPDQIDPRQLHVYSNGTGMLPQANATARQNQLTEMAIVVSGESDGKFDKTDYILFFAQGPDAYRFDTSAGAFQYTHNLYSDKNFYFITANGTAGKRMATSENQPGDFPVVSEFEDLAYYENEQNNILKSGRSWYGEQFSTSTSLTIQFNIPGIVAGSPIVITSNVMAQSFDAVSTFKVFVNDVQVTKHQIPTVPDSQYAPKGNDDSKTVTVTADQVGAAGKTAQLIRYQYAAASSGYSIGYLDNFLLSVKRRMAWYGTQTIYTSAQSLMQPTSVFTIDALPETAQVWDITNPFESQLQSFNFSAAQSSFSAPTTSLKRFISFQPDKAFIPVFESGVPNQNLSSLACPDLVIVTHPDFKTQAQRLASFRQSHNKLAVAVVTTDEIYNEYSGGKQDVTAIRDFVRALASRGGSGLDNLLIFGRCSYDYKNRTYANTNFVPTYESRNSLDPIETYSSDDYFSFFDPGEGDWPEDPPVNYSMDIGVGRIPVVTAAQANDVVTKLIAYETDAKRFGGWRNKIVFVADDGDNNLHQSSADQLATTVETAHPEILTEKLYVDQFRQLMRPSGQYAPDAHDALQRSIDDGAFLVNFTGHGSEHLWMQEQVFDDQLVENIRNSNRYPIFVTATCEFGRHDDPFQISNAERLLLTANAGAIGLVTTARPVQAVTNSYLNTAFYQQLFVKVNGTLRDLGTIFRATKNNSQSGVSNRNFSLLGDPSMPPALPSDTLVLTTLKTASGSDTLKALSTVIVKGEVRNSGVRNTGFNGSVNITLLDRPAAFVTKGDENPPFAYHQWSNAIFRGSADVVAGSFQSEFIVPQNIATAVADGKISLYSNSTSGDASGFSKFKIGGVEPDTPPDVTGPVVRVFLGDTSFVDGGIASPNTTLVVLLRDPSGIATTAVGDANNLIAVLDDSITYNLNEYYTAAPNRYTNGTASFQLFSIPAGRHAITVQASDTYGNRSAGTANFIVTEGNLVISAFYNYPNPFSTSSSTRFGFTHNRSGEDLDVELTIVDLTGRAVDTRQYSVTKSFADVDLAEWDGTTFAGNKLSSGIYLGKLSVRSLLDGSKNQFFTKLIIVN